MLLTVSFSAFFRESDYDVITSVRDHLVEFQTVLLATKTVDELEKRILALGQRWSCLQGSKSPVAKYATLRCVLTQQVRRSVVDNLGNDATGKLDHRNDASIGWKSHSLRAACSTRTSRRGLYDRTRAARLVFPPAVHALFAATVHALFPPAVRLVCDG